MNPIEHVREFFEILWWILQNINSETWSCFSAELSCYNALKKHIARHILLPDFFLEHLCVKPLTIPLCLLKLPLSFHSHPDLREQSQHGVQILGSLLWRFYPVVVCFCFSLYGHFKILSFFFSWVFLVNILRSRTALLQALLNRSYCELEVLS